MLILRQNTLLNQYLIKTIIFLLILLSPPSYCEEYFTQKDVLDAQNKAFALYSTDDEDEALKILEKIPINYQNEDMCLIIANIYEDKEDYTKAVIYLNRAIKINPKFYKAYYNLGCICMKKGDYKLAIENFKICNKLKSDFADSYYNLGCSYFKLEQYKNAKKSFISAINYSPKEKKYYYNLAVTYKKLNKERSAKKILDTYNALP